MGDWIIILENLDIQSNNKHYKSDIIEDIIFLKTRFFIKFISNLFDSSINIQFGLADDVALNIIIYDITGHEVLVLSEGKFS